MDNKEHIVKSKIIQAYTYDSSKQELTVTFTSGNSWLYKKVDPVLMSNVFDKPGSIGSKFLNMIKKSHQGIEQDYTNT
jgi:hypothetical protein